MLDDAMTVKETAALCKVSAWAVYQAVKRGEIPAAKLWNGQLRISRAELERTLAATGNAPRP